MSMEALIHRSARPFAGESASQMTAAARCHQALLDASSVEEAGTRGGADVRDMLAAARPTLPRPVDHRVAARAVRARAGAALGGTWGLLAATVFGLSPLLGAAAGAAAAGLIGLASVASARRPQGQVEIDDASGHRQSNWRDDSTRYAGDAAVTLTSMLARGDIGDRILAATATPPEVSGPALRNLNGATAALQSLDMDARLVADLGNRSRYGHAVLDRIDADMARRMLALDRAIYVVSGDKVGDDEIRTRVEIKDAVGQRVRSENLAATVRNFSYHVVEVKSASQLAEIGEAPGLPERISGVYRNSNEISQVVGGSVTLDSDERGWVSREKHQISRQFNAAKPAPPARPVYERYGVDTPQMPSIYTSGHIGGVVGAAMAVPAMLMAHAGGPLAAGFALASFFLGGFVGAVVGARAEEGR